MHAGNFEGFSSVNDTLSAATPTKRGGRLAVRWCVRGLPPRQARLQAASPTGAATTVEDGLRAVFKLCDFSFAPRGGEVPGEPHVSQCVVLAAGVEVEPDAALALLAGSLRHGDGWLYLVVRRREAPTVGFVPPPL